MNLFNLRQSARKTHLDAKRNECCLSVKHYFVLLVELMNKLSKLFHALPCGSQNK